MSEGRAGCFKIGCIGVLVFIVVVIAASWGFFASLPDNTEDVALPELTDSDRPSVGAMGSTSSPPVGRLELNLSQGAFYVHAADAGEATFVDADFDDDAYELVETKEVYEDTGKWLHRVDFSRKGGGLFSLFRAMRSDVQPEIHVYISRDEPIELVFNGHQGGGEIDLGGLWITSAHIGFHQGGAELQFSEPMRQPMDQLLITSRMGGIELVNVANASPALLDARVSMGGAEIDLDGEWLQDADIHVDVYMGGIELRVPDDVRTEGLVENRRNRRLDDSDPEVPERRLRFTLNSSMGEIEVR